MKYTNDTYYCAAKTLMQATVAINKLTGVTVKLDSDTKLAYVHARDQYILSKNNNNKFFASWDAIFLEVCDASTNTIQKKAKLLRDLGLVVVNKDNTKEVLDITHITDWVFANPKRDEFKTPEQKELRSLQKKERLKKYNQNKQSSTEEQTEPHKVPLGESKVPQEATVKVCKVCSSPLTTTGFCSNTDCTSQPF